MRPSLKALFHEHEKPTHCTRKDVHDANRALLALVASVQRESTEMRLLLGEAENDPDLPDAFRGKLEMLQQTEAASETATSDAIEALRKLTKIAVQRDRQLTEAKSDLEAWERRHGK